MNKIIRIWNQNRLKIIIIALAVVFIFIVIRALNAVAEKTLEEKNNNTIAENTFEEDMPTQSVITGETVSTETTKTNVNLIETFAQKCNEQDTKMAYSLLTEECKKILFPTEQDFINNYYNIIFTEPRSIDIENYKNSSKTNTYKVTFYSDVLSTGNISSGNTYQDYITIEKETQKISINSLIASEEMNALKEVNGILVNIVRQDIYKDFEKYEIKVTNNTNKKVLLDTRRYSSTVYATGNDNIKYSAFTSELANSVYELEPYTTKTYRLKFNKLYNSTIRTKKITFTDIVEDYEKYTQDGNEERLKIEIEF